MRDTISPEVKIVISSGRHQAQLSSRYTPTSVPEQDGRKNYVDNDQIMMSAGYTHTTKLEYKHSKLALDVTPITSLLETIGKKTSSDTPIVDELPNSVSIKTGELIPESEGLQTNNPGFPGFSSHGFGFIWSISIGVEI